MGVTHPFAYAATGPADVSDEDITVAIQSRFLVDQNVPADTIDVTTKEGVVTLAGNVRTLLARERAGKIVASIRGVKALINTIQVKPLTQFDDQSLQIRILAALAADPAADAYELDVDVDQGSVILSGTVDSWQEKKLSEVVVKSVNGVKTFHSLIQIQPAAFRPDAEIEAEIIRRLQSDVWVHEKLIGLMVDRGRVTLTGTVGSLAEKYSAYTDAWVSGVTAVNMERLSVEWWARDRMLRNPGDVVSSNIRTEEAVQTALRYDPRLHNIDIGVRVSDGTAILSGIVGNMAAKHAAEKTAKNTVGIWRVRNFINVRPTVRIPDEELEQRVREAFNQHPLIDRYAMKIFAKNGKVSLEGYLPTVEDISQAVRTASRIKGVTDIVNYLEVESGGKSDEEIWEGVRRSLWWDPRLHNREITVTVDNGIITLEGIVPSIVERRLARKIARESGAEEVRNHIQVRNGPESQSS